MRSRAGEEEEGNHSRHAAGAMGLRLAECLHRVVGGGGWGSRSE